MNTTCLDCGIVIAKPGPRCPAHTRVKQRARDAVRGTPAQRGYNATYAKHRALVLAGGPHPCAWGCGRLATTVDHLTPLARGGTNDIDNLVPACAACNYSRGSGNAPSAWVRRPSR